MMLALLATLAGSPAPKAAVAAVRSDDPPVKVWLNNDNYFRRGDKARVNVRLADDGYVVVLRADTDGRVRVLFPLDPPDDAFVRGHETIEVRGRGDREAFYVDDRSGSGVVLAARSASPFKFDEFVRGDHWDYRVLDARQSGDDKEEALLDIVQRMSDGHFDYDVASYTVETERGYSSYYPTSVGFGYGWGWPYYGYGLYSTCYDPFAFDPFLCYNPLFYAPYRFGFGFGFGFRPFIHRPRFFRPYINQPYLYGGGFFVNRQRIAGNGSPLYYRSRVGVGTNVAFGGNMPRFRSPQATPLDRRGGFVRQSDIGRRGGVDGESSFQGRDRSMRNRNDRPSDRSAPEAREPDRRGGSTQAAPDRGRDPGNSSAPRGGGGGGGDRGTSSRPANRGGGGHRRP
ncbi:MAG TPA: DUF4384 domain-containing protein [Gemmatimonadales bacterium]|nr:DUF4384 domain-containing protein [Gemmatimonadales bacterium]